MKKNVIDSAVVKDAETEIQEGDINTGTPVYHFRTLKSSDSFLMFKIISKIGIREFKDCFKSQDMKEMIAAASAGGKSMTSITAVGAAAAFEIVGIIIENLPRCETEVYQLLSSTSNLTVNQVKEMDFVTFTEMVIDFVKKEEFTDFIKVVSKSFKLAN